jgi:hypothetical protein
MQMPMKKTVPDKTRAVTGIVKENMVNIVEQGDCIQPAPPFKPTTKTQSGEFSRDLPSYHSHYLEPGYRRRFGDVIIGAKNPYAIVNRNQAIQNLVITNWTTTDMKIRELKALIADNVSPSGTSLPFEHCFDPAYNSLIFPSEGAIQKAIWRTAQSHAPPFGTDVHTAGGAQDQACYQNPNYVQSQVNWVNHPPTYDAPIQGTGSNCWLLAAMSSIAWTDKTFFVPTNADGIFVLLDDPNSDPATNLDNSFIYPDNSLPLKTGNLPTSTNFAWSHSKYLDMWVPMLERAFAMRMLYPASVPDQGVQPNICTCFGPGSPLYALYLLKGDNNFKQFTNKTADYPANNINNLKWSADDAPLTLLQVNTPLPAPAPQGTLWDWLYNKNCYTLNAPNIFRPTTYTTVAFTYDTQDPLVTSPQEGTPCQFTYPAPKSSGVAYNSDLFVASHSYSVLGSYIQNGTNYILLRNPWGQIRTVVNSMAAAKFLDATLNISGFGPLWIPDPNIKNCPVANYILQDGVFAMRFDKFGLYFRGLGWV